MTANTYLDYDATTKVAKRVTASTAGGEANANTIPQLSASGRWTADMMPEGLAAETKVMPASEGLAAGDVVNVYSDAGTLKCRKADASAANAGKACKGFVLAAVTQDEDATVYYEGNITGLSGLTPGADYYLSATSPGGVTTTPTLTVGYVIQYIGQAQSATEMTFEPEVICIY